VRAGGNTSLPEQHFSLTKRNIKISNATLHVSELWGRGKKTYLRNNFQNQKHEKSQQTNEIITTSH
jgi:hypothetical protein